MNNHKGKNDSTFQTELKKKGKTQGKWKLIVNDKEKGGKSENIVQHELRCCS